LLVAIEIAPASPAPQAAKEQFPRPVGAQTSGHSRRNGAAGTRLDLTIWIRIRDSPYWVTVLALTDAISYG
jgi:hypothetical protein